MRQVIPDQEAVCQIMEHSHPDDTYGDLFAFCARSERVDEASVDIMSGK